MKDPAFLFYSQDFLTGTYCMDDEQVGKYIRLLCLQHQKGALTEKDMLKICRTYDEDIFCKFTKLDGLFFNKRLKDESEKRANYSESRRNNRKTVKNESYEKDMLNISKTYDPHMENENENENENVIESKIENERQNNVLEIQNPVQINNVGNDLISNDKSDYNLCTEVFFHWSKHILKVPAKMDAAQGKSLKSIIKYLKGIITTEKTPENIADAFKMILDHYENWDGKTDKRFYRTGIKLNQINSNLPNIINNIKNGNRNRNADAYAGFTFAD